MFDEPTGADVSTIENYENGQRRTRNTVVGRTEAGTSVFSARFRNGRTKRGHECICP